MTNTLTIGHAVPLPPTAQGSHEWLNQRRDGIGGSDVACIMAATHPHRLSQSPWSGPHDIYASKVHGVDGESSVAMRCGHALEDLVLELTAEAAAIDVITDVPACYRHPLYSWCFGSLDGVVVRDGVVVAGVEAKTSGDYSWDVVPHYYVLQVQWYMFVLGLPRFYVGCIFGKNAHDWWIIEADAELHAQMLAAASEFWVDHVLSEIPPSMDWSPACLANVMRTVTHVDSADKVPLGDVADALLVEREEVRASIKVQQQKAATLTTAIIARMPAKRCEGSSHNVTLVSKEALDRNALKADEPDVYDSCMVDGKPYFSAKLFESRHPVLRAEYTRPKGKPYITTRKK